jgi:hypothetical protein
MDKIKEHTTEFKTKLNGSGYEFSDEFLYGLISELKLRVEYLEQTLESDGK